MSDFKKGELVYYDYKQLYLNPVLQDSHPGFFCVVRGIQKYRNIPDHILLVYEHEKDVDSLMYRFVAHPEHLIKLEPDTPQNRLAIQIKYG